MKSHIVALSVAMACTGAFAQSKAKDDSTYIQLGYSSTQYNLDGISGLSNANSLAITLGKNMSENYAWKASMPLVWAIQPPHHLAPPSISS